mgnify:CR=1 FL=1
MDTKDIFYLNQVLKDGSLAKASKTLYVTPQAISKVIKKVENELGVELFTRSKEGMRPTEKGRLFFAESEELMQRMSKLHSMFEKEEENVHGVIRIACALGIIATLGPEAIFAFQKKYPNFTIQVNEGDDYKVEKMVWDEEADIGFAIGDIDEEKFTILKKRQIPHTLVVSTNHKLAMKKSISIRELAEERIVLESKKFKVNGKFIQLCENEGFYPLIYFETTEISLAHKLAKNENCVAISVETESEGLQGVKILDIQEDFNWEWCMIIRKNKVLSNMEKKYIDSIPF